MSSSSTFSRVLRHHGATASVVTCDRTEKPMGNTPVQAIAIQGRPTTRGLSK
jgi:hypothetical protein